MDTMYFKIISTNRENIYQYTNGLNIAPSDYDDNTISGSIKTGYFYIETAETISQLYRYGDILYSIELPTDHPDFKQDGYNVNMIIVKGKYPLSDQSIYDKFGLPYPTMDLCAKKGWDCLVKYWMEYGVDDKIKEDAFTNAVGSGNLAMVKYFMENGINVPMVYGLDISTSSVSVVKYLLDNGIKLDINMAFYIEYPGG